MWQARGVDATEARHRQVISTAWDDYPDRRAITAIDELSAMVSTNRVYRLTLDDDTHVIAKSSNYGSFFLFTEWGEVVLEKRTGMHVLEPNRFAVPEEHVLALDAERRAVLDVGRGQLGYDLAEQLAGVVDDL